MSLVLLNAIRSNDAAELVRVLDAHPELKGTLDAPLPGYSFGQTALMAAAHQGNREMIDVLLRAGADINQKSHWWAGPFHVLDAASPHAALPSFLIARGAVMEIHHAVQLGMIDEVRRMLAGNPSLVHARGGDGQLPLHFAQTVEMAQELVRLGAGIDARDVDHESTAAQYMVRDRQPVARYLVEAGAGTDVLMAAALGDAAVLRRLLAGDPGAIRTRVSRRWFPMRDPRAGGSIYIWTLGGDKGAHEIAREFGHEDVFGELMERTPPPLQLAVACEMGDRSLVAALRANGTVIDPEDQDRLVAAASRDRPDSVRLMLEAGWPADAAADGATALHWAAFHGNAPLVEELLRRGAPRGAVDRKYHGTPRGWAEHGAQQGGRGSPEMYAEVLRLLS